MSRHRTAASLALATAFAGLVSNALPSVSALEDSLGLRWLFQVRGRAAPPSNVVLVNVDETAAARLDLPLTLRDWPRSTHANLLDRLVARGVSAVAFDITFFRHGSPDDDQAFAEALARAGRAVLVQRLEIPRVGSSEISQRQDPIPVLANAAQGLAPVPLPDTPLVSEFWTFIGTPHASDVPTLPAVLLQLHGRRVLGPFVALLERAGLRDASTLVANPATMTSGELLRFMQAVRRGIQRDAAVRARLSRMASDVATSDGGLLRALTALYTGGDTAYLNFYGAPGTICAVPYDAVYLADSAQPLNCPLRGALVLVGTARGAVGRADQPDTYHTVMDGGDGLSFSGVEIQATALANLLSRTAITAPHPAAHAGLLTLLGGVLGAVGYYVRTRRRLRPGPLTARVQAAAVLTAVVAIYVLFVNVAFQALHVALPLIVPLAIQLPAALILGLVARPTEHQEQLRAVCLAADAAGSTAIGQRLPPGPYARLLNEYNQTLCGPARSRGGATLEPQGDGFVCLWCTPAGRPDAATRLQACLAALEMADASRHFDHTHPDEQRLPTRVGLTVGTVTVYSDADRGVFKAFGDAVNVAARLRDLNVELGTHVLAGDRVVEGLDTALTIGHIPGQFELKGVTHPMPVFEIRTARAYVPDAPSSPLRAGIGI